MSLNTMGTIAQEYNYGPKEEITVGSSPFVLVNEYAFGVRVYIQGGVLTGVSYKQNAQGDFQGETTYESMGVPTYVDVSPGDQIRVTYGIVAPTMIWHPI